MFSCCIFSLSYTTRFLDTTCLAKFSAFSNFQTNSCMYFAFGVPINLVNQFWREKDSIVMASQLHRNRINIRYLLLMCVHIWYSLPLRIHQLVKAVARCQIYTIVTALISTETIVCVKYMTDENIVCSQIWQQPFWMSLVWFKLPTRPAFIVSATGLNINSQQIRTNILRILTEYPYNKLHISS